MKKKIIAFALMLIIAMSSLSMVSFAINSYGIGVNIDGSSFGGGIDVKKEEKTWGSDEPVV